MPERPSWPEHLTDQAWEIMERWQDFVHARPDDASALALFDLLADMLLNGMAYTHQWTLETTLLAWYRELAPRIAVGLEKRWNEDDEDTAHA